ncbi:hypothetical protein GALMADRAFT_805231 [Galerina marginata CBS 339.88]|uniref:DUF6534 domain-containing protein n=1 Tax=Galerina marginata (strain CBS 339.88) TaxID=685588 RepID=A0A067SJM4_GALM3|nr:hypothetical protein GALMADRAFT_805231 [Galerina marginata CBS 339.88]
MSLGASQDSKDLISPIQPSQFLVESNGILGAVEVATFLSLILYGVSLSQVYTYFRRSGGDRASLKMMVVFLLFLETFHSFTAAMAVYYDTVTRWKTAQANSYPISTNVLLETLITLLVQCFFSLRVYRLSKRLSVGIACCALALLRFISGIAISVENFLDVPKVPNGIEQIERFSWVITAGLACGSAADILIAIFMTYYLRKLASPANLDSTTEVINRLVRFALQTGLITSMTSLAVIGCFQAMPNLVWFSLYILLAKLYSNSLLVSLNARTRKIEVIDIEKTHASELVFTSPGYSGPVSVSNYRLTVPWRHLGTIGFCCGRYRSKSPVWVTSQNGRSRSLLQKFVNMPLDLFGQSQVRVGVIWHSSGTFRAGYLTVRL